MTSVSAAIKLFTPIRRAKIVRWHCGGGGAGQGSLGFFWAHLVSPSGRDLILEFLIHGACYWLLVDERPIKCHPRQETDFTPWIPIGGPRSTQGEDPIWGAEIRRVEVDPAGVRLGLTCGPIDERTLSTPVSSLARPPHAGSGEPRDFASFEEMMSYWRVDTKPSASRLRHRF